MLRNAWHLLAGKGFSFTFDRIPLHMDNVSQCRTGNLFKAALDHVLGATQMSSLPPILQIEPTNICNLSCPLCPSQSMSRPKGMMTMKTFETILHGVGDTQLLAILYGWGEPFLNKNMPAMIARCRDKGILTLTSTNGHCLQPLDEARTVVDAGLSALVVAMDGATQESYSAYRKGGALERVLRCIENIQNAKAGRNSPTPFVNLRLVANRYNEGQIAEMEAVARDLKVDMFSIKSLGCLPNRPEFDTLEPRYQGLRRFGTNRKNSSEGKTFRCAFPFRQPTVFWDGTLVGCEFDYELSHAWGNVNDAEFSALWNSPVARQHRFSLHNGGKKPSFCASCPYTGRGQNSSIVHHVLLTPSLRNEPSQTQDDPKC